MQQPSPEFLNAPEFLEADVESRPEGLRDWVYGCATQAFNKRRLPYWLLAAVCAAANMLLPSAFWSFTKYVLPTAMCGGLTTQLALVTTFAALSVQSSWAWKLWAGLIVLMIWATYMTGLFIADGRGGVPIEPVVFLLAVTVIGALWHFVILIYFKSLSGFRIAHSSDELEQISIRRLGVGTLMTATTVVAIGFCIVRWLIPEKAVGWPQIMHLVVGAITLGVGASVISIMSMMLMLTPRLSIVGFIGFVLTLPFWYGFHLVGMYLVGNGNTKYELAASFILGHAFFSLLGFGFVRLTGYRYAGIHRG